MLLRHYVTFQSLHDTDIIEWRDFQKSLTENCVPHLERLKDEFKFDFDNGKDNFALHGYEHSEKGWSVDIT